eukprot:394816_1
MNDKLKQDAKSKFKHVYIHQYDQLNASSFIHNIRTLSETKNVKESGGFFVLRIKDDICEFSTLQASKKKIRIFKQTASEFPVPLMSWNDQHKNKVITQNGVYNSSDNKDQNNNLELCDYRGFCSMMKNTTENQCVETMKTEQFIDENQTDNNPYEDVESIEDKYLTFIQHFYEHNAVRYGHIVADDDEQQQLKNSPFSVQQQLKKYGPFSHLSQDEYLPGVQIPLIYIGNSHTYFPWHNEDMNFYSAHYSLTGNSKIWYCISSCDYTQVMTYFRKQFPHYYTNCFTPLQHQECLMDPYIFACLGITVHCILQKPGDIVITPPGGLYFNFNESFNICSKVSFMTFNENEWILSLSYMLTKSYNYHDCCLPNKCLCCKQLCISPETTLKCQCNKCDKFKCPCDSTIFYDINVLAVRVRQHSAVKLARIPIYEFKQNDFEKEYGYQYKITSIRNMSDSEIDARWISPPLCKIEYVYPTQDIKDTKFYPAICFNNRIIKNDELSLVYLYQMDFIGYGGYYQICNNKQIITAGGTTPQDWNNPPQNKQHGFYTKGTTKGTPSFDFLKIQFNEYSPLIDTEWENKNIIYAYPSGSRKYNLQSRKNEVQNRIEQQKQSFEMICSFAEPEDVKYHTKPYTNTDTKSDTNTDTDTNTDNDTNTDADSSFDPNGKDRVPKYHKISNNGDEYQPTIREKLIRNEPVELCNVTTSCFVKVQMYSTHTSYAIISGKIGQHGDKKVHYEENKETTINNAVNIITKNLNNGFHAIHTLFRGQCIALCGNFTTTHNNLQKLIRKYGGTIHLKPNKKTNFMLVPKKNTNLYSKRCSECCKLNIPIITEDFIHECIKNNELQNFDSYKLQQVECMMGHKKKVHYSDVYNHDIVYFCACKSIDCECQFIHHTNDNVEKCYRFEYCQSWIVDCECQHNNKCYDCCYYYNCGCGNKACTACRLLQCVAQNCTTNVCLECCVIYAGCVYCKSCGLQFF